MPWFDPESRVIHTSVTEIRASDGMVMAHIFIAKNYEYLCATLLNYLYQYQKKQCYMQIFQVESCVKKKSEFHRIA